MAVGLCNFLLCE